MILSKSAPFGNFVIDFAISGCSKKIQKRLQELVRNKLSAASADLERVQSLAKTHEDPQSEVKASCLLASIRAEQSKSIEAAKLAEAAVVKSRSDALYEDLIDASRLLAMIKLRQGKSKEGVEGLERTIAFLNGIKTDQNERQKLNNLTAMLYFKEAELGLASGESSKLLRPILEKGLQLLSNRRDYYRWSLEGVLLDARFLASEGKKIQALEKTRHVQTPALALKDWDMLARAYLEEYWILKKQGKEAEADKAGKNALDYAKDAGNRFITLKPR